MPTITLCKRLKALYAYDEAAEVVVNKLAQGEIIEVTYRRPRNQKHHKLFFALLSLVWSQLDQDDYPTVETLLTELKIRTGHYDRRDIEVEGKKYPVLTPKSISFASMGQDEFAAFFERVCDLVVRDLLPGIHSEELRQEVEIMAGAKVGA
jgi:hypothetical protein